MYRRFLCLAAEFAPGIETGAAGGVVRSWECNGNAFAAFAAFAALPQ